MTDVARRQPLADEAKRNCQLQASTESEPLPNRPLSGGRRPL